MKNTNEKVTIDTVKILDNLLSSLTKREKDILGRRFGLDKKERETLKNIGDAHNLTRERVRQVESAGVNKIKKLKEVDKYLEELKDIARQLLQEHGGVAEKNYLLKLLSRFSADEDEDQEEITKNRLEFLLSKLLQEDIEEIKGTKNLQNAYKIKDHELDHLEEIAEELVSKIEELKSTQKTQHLFDLLTELSSYNKYKERIHQQESKVKLTDIIQDHYPEEDPETVDKNKPLYSLLHTTKHLGQNKFGHWGLHYWNEVKPKRINDKIYLILKHKQQPMHFEEIAEEINRIGFDKKKANPATIHNELILDEQYVLVGRGIYGLSEWGYKRGVVIDVIKDILEREGRPMSKEEIIEKVLENRLVKKTTINLALMNKDIFEKMEDGRYRLKK